MNMNVVDSYLNASADKLISFFQDALNDSSYKKELLGVIAPRLPSEGPDFPAAVHSLVMEIIRLRVVPPWNIFGTDLQHVSWSDIQVFKRNWAKAIQDHLTTASCFCKLKDEYAIDLLMLNDHATLKLYCEALDSQKDWCMTFPGILLLSIHKEGMRNIIMPDSFTPMNDYPWAGKVYIYHGNDVPITVHMSGIGETSYADYESLLRLQDEQ